MRRVLVFCVAATGPANFHPLSRSHPANSVMMSFARDGNVIQRTHQSRGMVIGEIL